MQMLNCHFREDVECDLTFGGLIAMENTLKPETTPVIKILKNANIRTVMITGELKPTSLGEGGEGGEGGVSVEREV